MRYSREYGIFSIQWKKTCSILISNVPFDGALFHHIDYWFAWHLYILWYLDRRTDLLILLHVSNLQSVAMENCFLIILTSIRIYSLRTIFKNFPMEDTVDMEWGFLVTLSNSQELSVSSWEHDSSTVEDSAPSSEDSDDSPLGFSSWRGLLESRFYKHLLYIALWWKNCRSPSFYTERNCPRFN